VFDFLPPAKSDELSDAPVATVIAQIKFSNQSILSTHRGASSFQDSLVDHYPRLLPESQSVITAAPGNVSSSAIPQWRLTDFDNVWSCVVGPEQLTIETKSYKNWSSMRERLEEALVALGGVTTPRIRERVGLRYVNHIPANPDGSYTGLVNSHLLGITEAPGWKEALTLSMSQLVISDGPAQVAVRYGRGPASVGLPENAWVLDIDCFDDSPAKFDTADLMIYFDNLNDAALRCFYESLGGLLKTSLIGEGRP
jgi:uncharacterized protein (TIGR04255 family)